MLLHARTHLHPVNFFPGPSEPLELLPYLHTPRMGVFWGALVRIVAHREDCMEELVTCHKER